MGADLIGYMIHIPVVGLDSLVTSHLEDLKAVIESKNTKELEELGIDAGNIFDSHWGEGPFADNNEMTAAEMTAAEMTKLFEHLQTQLELVEEEFSIAGLDNYRNVYSRYGHVNGVEILTIFSGEMSWGDTPEGAYLVLQAAMEIGLVDLLEGTINWGAEPPRPKKNDLRSDDPEENRDDDTDQDVEDLGGPGETGF